MLQSNENNAVRKNSRSYAVRIGDKLIELMSIKPNFNDIMIILLFMNLHEKQKPCVLACVFC